MKKLMTNTISTILALAFSSILFADQKPNNNYKGSAALEKMKTLAGTWKGKSSGNKKNGDKHMDNFTVNYKVTSGGSAVVETTFPGTPREMVSIYSDVKGKLSMTHYCMLRNQPKMTLKKSSKNQIVLSYNGGQNINPKKEMHMSGLTLDIKSKDKIVQNWSMNIPGKKPGVNAMVLTRVKK